MKDYKTTAYAIRDSDGMYWANGSTNKIKTTYASEIKLFDDERKAREATMSYARGEVVEMRVKVVELEEM